MYILLEQQSFYILREHQSVKILIEQHIIFLGGNFVYSFGTSEFSILWINRMFIFKGATEYLYFLGLAECFYSYGAAECS